MKPEFMIFKEGTTTYNITICSKNGEPFNREAKIAKYKSLGYRVFELDGTEII